MVDAVASNATALIWRLLLVAERTVRCLDYPGLLPEVALGATYKNGIRVAEKKETTTTDREVAGWATFTYLYEETPVRRPPLG
jgi:hypothetical protein